MPKPVIPPPPVATEEVVETVLPKVQRTPSLHFEKDDIILMAVLLTLIMNGCEDKLLLIALGALLLFDL